MHDPMNPQAEQMTDASMRRTLALQAEAIWPQEARLFERYRVPENARILDVACGTGEITYRLARRYPRARVLGVDIEPQLLDVARRNDPGETPNVAFEEDNAYRLSQPDAAFDLTVCRHLLQILPEPENVLRELVRVTKPGGWVHVLSEDYGMIHFYPTALDNERFWLRGPVVLGRALGTDMRIGRATYTHLHELGLADLSADYIVVDTVRVPRDVFIGLWEAWRDGYTDVLARHTEFSREEVAAHWADMLACLRNPAGYAVWHVPVISGRRPG